MPRSGPARLFQSALSCYQQRQFAQAGELCTQLLKLAPDSDDAMHLLALCSSHTAPHHAEYYFKRAIATAPANKIYQKSYANFLLANRQYTTALAIYQQLYTHSQTDPDVVYGLAFIHYQQKRYRAALKMMANIDSQASSAAKWQMLKSRALLECGDAEAALQILGNALKQEPSHAGLMLTKILVLRQLQQPQQALACLQLMPENAIHYYLAGCLNYDMQQYTLAEQQLRQALALQPDYIDAHAALNKLYWEHNNSAQFLNSFAQALAVVPTSVAVYLSYLSHLLMAGQTERAVTIATQAIEQCGEQHPLLHALGTLYYKQSDSERAMQLYQQALAQMPDNIRYLLDNANLLIKKQDYQAALTLLQRARHTEPDNQEVWAYLGLCWRLTTDPQHQWLNNYSQLISIKKLATPPGYARFTDFWQELKAAVNSLHTTEHPPLDQSVRHGTQTVGFLFNNPAPVIQLYRRLLTEHLQHYLASLPVDPAHPLLRRNQPEFRFSGSWSVKLHNNGFHTNHVHPQGWLSVCTYLNVPETISAADPTCQGWLKLGETSLQLGDKEQVARTICPEEGLCVIFPSYIWHGTVPFHGDGARITLPCDVVPDV